MCPVSVTGNPGILMSHACIDLTFLPSGRLMVRGFVATCLFATSTPSITKMDVAPVSATAWFGAMVIALIYCGFWRLLVSKFDMTTVTSSWSAIETTFMFSVGFRTKAETKLLHLCAVNAPRPRPLHGFLCDRHRVHHAGDLHHLECWCICPVPLLQKVAAPCSGLGEYEIACGGKGSLPRTSSPPSAVG